MSAAIAEPPDKAVVEAAPPAPKPPGEEAASFLESLNGDRSDRRKPSPAPAPAQDKDSEEKAKADKDAADKAKADKETKAKSAAAPKKPAPAPPPPAAEPDYEKIAEAAGRGVAAAIKKTESEAKADDPAADLSADEREWYEAYSQMEKDYPEDKGLVKKYLDSLKEQDVWEAKWLESHPGEELSEDNAEFKSFIEKNSVRYSELRLQKSLARIEAEKMVKSEREKGSAEVAELKLKEREREAEPRVMASRVAAARNYFDALGDEFKEVLDAAGNINREAIVKLVESDPLKQIALTAAEGVEEFAHGLQNKSETFVHELREITADPKLFDIENEHHLEIDKFIKLNENHLASLPVDDQVAFIEAMPAKLRNGRSGKRFATAAKYAAMSANERGQYFRLNSDDVVYLKAVDQAEATKQYAANQAESVKKFIAAEEKRIDELAEKRGFKKVEATLQATSATVETTPKPTPAAPLPPSPSGAIEPRQALPHGGALPAAKNAADSFTKQWLG